MTWLKRDALNRFWRAVLQTAGVVILIPAGDAALQVLRLALVDAASGKGFDWNQVATSAAWSAGVGATMAVLAYIHRLKLDPSRFPSATPPAPPTSAPPRMAQR